MSCVPRPAAPRACSSMSRSTRPARRRRSATWPTSWPAPWSATTPRGGVEHAPGPARRQGADRLEPEPPGEDDDRPVLAAGPAPPHGVRSRDLGRGGPVRGVGCGRAAPIRGGRRPRPGRCRRRPLRPRPHPRRCPRLGPAGGEPGPAHA